MTTATKLPRRRRADARLPPSTKWTRSPLGTLLHANGWNIPNLATNTGYSSQQLRWVLMEKQLPTVEMLLRFEDVTGLPGTALLEACRQTLLARATASPGV